MNDRKRILSRRSRTPGKALTKDDLSNVTGGRRSGIPVPGCCASGPPPRIAEQTRLRWATPLTRDAEGRLRLHDPAWPAALPAALHDDPWVEQCATAVPAGTLARPGSPRWTLLQTLVDDGLLVVSTRASEQGVAA